MRISVLLIASLIFSCALHAQSLPGTWSGNLKVGSVSLRFIMHIKQADGKWSATFDSPDQNAFGITAGETIVSDDSVKVAMPALKAAFNGKWDKANAIRGTFRQGNAELPLLLERSNESATPAPQPKPVVKNRPQLPKPPFPYATEEVSFQSKDKSVQFGGTLSKPNGDKKFPAIIIISGSGTQDRDGTLFDHKPYLVLGDHLTRQGWAVLRVDDRGAGKSTLGDISNITTETLSRDTEAALDYLLSRNDIDKNKIVLIGHSEGGIIAPMLAARRKEIAGLILWGAPATGGTVINTHQNAHALKNAGLDDVAVNAFTELHMQVLQSFAKANKDNLNASVKTIYDAWRAKQSQTTLSALGASEEQIVGKNIYSLYHSLYDLPWMRYFITYDPATDLKKIKRPVLAINGTKDTQVPADENLAAIAAALEAAGNKKVSIQPLQNLNHMLQTAQTGELAEYESIEETIAPSALSVISNWLSSLGS